MNKMRDLIRSHPYLLISSIVVLVIFWLPVFVVQDLPKKGWNTYLEDDNLSLYSDIVIDDQGWIWVSACSPKKKELYLFNGSGWTTMSGSYCDLALGPDGRIWAVAKNAHSVTVFDGEQETTWSNHDLGIDPGDKIELFQIDQSGGLWMTLHLKNIDASTSPAEHQLVRVILDDGKPPRLTRFPELLPFEGGFHSLYADSQGRVWVSVWKSNIWHHIGSSYMFDGKEWLPVQLSGSKSDWVVQTALDDKGRSWLITTCNNIYKQTNNSWERVIKGSDCSFSSADHGGIAFDNHGRLWAWGHNLVRQREDGNWINLSEDDVRYLDGNKWIIFNEYNSGVGTYISGVVFDEQDRIWVASDKGVSMTGVENLQPLPKILVDFREFVVEHFWWGEVWFIPTMLILTWLAAYLGMLPGVLVAFGAGLAASVIWNMFIGIFVSIGGTIGGFIGGSRDRRSGVPVDRWTNMNVVLSIIGSVIGFGIGFIVYEIILLGF